MDAIFNQLSKEEEMEQEQEGEAEGEGEEEEEGGEEQNEVEEEIGIILEAEPGQLDFELVPIYETKTKSFRITNFGDTLTEAELIVCHEDWLRDYPQELIQIHPKSLKLRPNQSVEITVTVRPTRANIQHFYVIYQPIINGEVKDLVLDGGGGYGIEVHDGDIHNTHLVDITFIGDHSIVEVTDVLFVAKHPVWNSNQCRHMFSMDMLNQCLNPYHSQGRDASDGKLPVIPSVHCRFPPGTLGSETSVFQVNLQLSNHMDLKGHWELFTAPPPDWHRLLKYNRTRYKSLSDRLVIGPDGRVKDSPELLAALWGKKFGFGGKTVCSKPKYHNRSPARSRKGDGKSKGKKPVKCDMNSDADMFQISPTRGVAKGKEVTTLTFKYNFKRSGSHQISVLLRVYPSIFIWLELTSQTLGVDEPFIQLMEHKVMKLKPISVSDLDPPMQMLWAYNGGNVPAGFSVDMEPFYKLKKENFDHAAIECLTPSGIVPPKSWFPIKLRFSPIEYTDYSVPLTVHPEFSDKSLEVILKGSALFATATRLRPDADLSRMKAFAATDAVPVTLSPTHISFPHFIPTGQKATSLVFLTNLHAKHTMSFRWPEVPIEGGGSIRFQPATGKIEPNGSATCLVIANAGKVPVTFATMIRCMLEDESEKGNYNVQYKQWKTNTEFIDTRKPQGTKRNPAGTKQPPSLPAPFSCLLAASVYIGTVFGLYDVITPKERSRMPSTDPVAINRPIPSNPDLHSGLVLSDFEREISKEIISNLLLDIITSPGFETTVRTLTKRNPPLYEEYKESEEKAADNHGEIESSEQIPELAQEAVEEILEGVVFNLIQELNSNYVNPITRENWHDLSPVQPTAFINIEENRECL